jgi:hypothetical protein
MVVARCWVIVLLFATAASGGAVITNGLLCNADELQSAVKKNARPCITIRRPRRGLLLPATLYYIESFPFLQ